MNPSCEILAKADSLFIEVEMPERDIKSFSTRYSDLGAGCVNKATPGVLMQKNHGYNCRIYFNACDAVVQQLAMFGYVAICGDDRSPRGHRHSEYKWRLDSNSFFWKLVADGFKLGQRQAILRLEQPTPSPVPAHAVNVA